MPKLKTNKSIAKRVKITRKGKIKKRTAGRSHILGKKTRKRKRHMRRSSYLSASDAQRVRRMLPYG